MMIGYRFAAANLEFWVGCLRWGPTSLQDCMGGPAVGAGTGVALGFVSLSFFNFSEHVARKAEKFWNTVGETNTGWNSDFCLVLFLVERYSCRAAQPHSAWPVLQLRHLVDRQRDIALREWCLQHALRGNEGYDGCTGVSRWAKRVWVHHWAHRVCEQESAVDSILCTIKKDAGKMFQ